MGKGAWLGEFEQLVMLAVLRLENEAYGMEVRREIAACAGRETAIGAVYATLERLAQKGYLRSRETPDRDSARPRRAYQVTAEGHRALDQALAAIAKMRDGLRLSPGRSKA